MPGGVLWDTVVTRWYSSACQTLWSAALLAQALLSHDVWAETLPGSTEWARVYPGSW